MSKNKRRLLFFAFASRLIEERRRTGRDNTADLYRTTRNRVCRFMHGKELDLRDVTPGWVSRFVASLRAEGLRPNSVRTYLSNLIRVGLTPATRGLIAKYAVAGSRYLFPILPADCAVGHEEYKALLRSYNRTLREIGASLSTPVRLTSYTFRHSWATNAYRKHVPLSVISQALGHTSEQTTRHYLSALDQSELNRENKRVTGEIERLLATG